MSEHTIAAPTSEAMQELGRRVAGMVHGGDVLLLSGPCLLYTSDAADE